MCSAVGSSSIFPKLRTASRGALKNKRTSDSFSLKKSKSKNRRSKFLFQISFEKQEWTPDGYQVGS